MMLFDGNSITNHLDAVAERENPVKAGDFFDNQGLLHCGKCGAVMEYIQKLENIKINQAFYESRTEEQRKRIDDMRKMLAGRKHRIPCKCKENERRNYEKQQREQAIKDNIKYCFGNSTKLLSHVFSVDDRKDSQASKNCRRYADNFEAYKQSGWKLILYGDAGGGKTFYASAIANSLLERGYRVKFTNINDITAQVNRYYFPFSTAISNLCENDLIILDDFGAEETSEKMISNTFQIINAIYERQKPLVVTTNLTYEELHEPQAVGQKRIYSRLLEHATTCKVESVKGNRRISI